MIGHRIATVALALWTGSLITVCGLVAPTAFAILERRAAGQMAARMFTAETFIGVVAVVIILATQRIAGFSLSRSVVVLVCVAAAGPLVSHLVLSPMMETARSAGDMARFGALHGVSALLFAAACLCSLGALWLFTRPAA